MTEEKHKQIRCRVILEILGKPKEHVERTMKDYIGNIKEEEGLIVLKESIAEAKEQGKLWSTFAELELVFKGMIHMTAFCFHYMPSSIEIIKPEELIIKNNEISNFMNDLQAKLHNVDMVAKKLRAENDFLRRNMKMSMKNTIGVLLKMKEMDSGEVSKFTGIPKNELKIILEELVKENKIKKEEDKYKLA